MTFDVSVIVPTFNRAPLIGETIDSILAQSVAPAEVIVVDDGSTDDTAAALARFGPRVRYHRIENSGPSAARNAGVAIATGAWIAFCDSDDLWRPNKLERQLRLHALCPTVEYSLTDFDEVVSGEWRRWSVFATVPPSLLQQHRRVVAETIWIYEASLYRSYLLGLPIWPSTLLMSKRRFETLGGFDERFSKGLSEDLDFHLRNVGVPPIGILAEPVVGIRKHPENRSADLVRNLLDQLKILEYAVATHAAARPCMDVLLDEIQNRRARAAGRAFASGRLDIVRDLAPSIERRHRDWKATIKFAVASLPMPLARPLQQALVTANEHLVKLF